MLAARVGRRHIRLYPLTARRTITNIRPIDQDAQEPPRRSKVKLQESVDPSLVEPVLQWLADESASKPFIPVQAKFEEKAPSFLPLKAFCGPFRKNELVHLDPTVFSHPIRRDILHACVTWYRDSLRTGTASTKTRAQVGYSNKKIRPQKGSGRARLGDRGSPMLRGGGRAFGPKPRDFSSELNRKVKEMGIRVALSVKIRERRLDVVPSVEWPNWQTRLLAQRVKGMFSSSEPGGNEHGAREKEMTRGVLIVSGAESVPKRLEQASRNLKYVTVKTVKDVQVWDILKAGRTILSLDAVEWFQEHLGVKERRPEVDFENLVAAKEEKSAPSVHLESQ